MKNKVSIPKFLKRIFKILAWTFGSIIGIFISLSALLLIPSVQNFITKKAANYLSEETNMKVDIGSIHIAFPKAIRVEKIFIEDLNYDTLLYCKEIKIDTDLIPLVRQKINVNYLLIEGLRADINKSKADSTFNFSPLLSVFKVKEKSKNDAPKTVWKIGFDEIELKDIKARYINKIDSSGIFLDLGQLSIVANAVDVLNSKFDIENIDLQNTSLTLTLAPENNKDSINNPNTTNKSIPIDLNLGQLNADNIHFNLNTIDEKLGISVKLNSAMLKPEIIDLKSTSISMENIEADGIDVALKILPQELKDTVIIRDNFIQKAIEDQYTFGNFSWNFVVNHSEISNTSYKMDIGSEPRNTTEMDYRHMRFSKLNLIADSMYFNKNSTGATVSSLSGKEVSGGEIEHISGVFSLDNQYIVAKNVEMSTIQSSIEGYASLGYPSLRSIGNNIDSLEITTDLSGIITLEEISPFTSVLETYPLLKNVNSIEVKKIKTSGHFSNFQLERCLANVSDATFVVAHGSITGLPKVDKLAINLTVDTLFTSADDIHSLLPDTLIPSQLKLPKFIGMQSNINFTSNASEATINLKTSYGEAFAKAELNGENIKTEFSFQNFDIEQLLEDSTYGETDLKGIFAGTLEKGTLTNFKTQMDIARIVLLDNAYHNMDLELKGKSDHFQISSQLEDSLISYKLDGEAILKATTNHYNFKLNIRKADLKKMNILDEDLVISATIDIDTEYSSFENQEGLFKVANLKLNKNNDEYLIDDIEFDADIQKGYTNFTFKSDIIDANLTGNIKLIELQKAFYNHLNNYLAIPDSLLSEKEYNFEFDLQFKKPDFFTEFLIDGLNKVIIKTCKANYNGATDKFDALIEIPEFNYKNIMLDNLKMDLKSEQDSVISVFSLDQLSYDSASVKNIRLISKFSDQNAAFDFTISDIRDSLKYQFAPKISHMDSTYFISFDPKKLVIDHNKWTVSNDNVLKIRNRALETKNAIFRNGDQKIWLETGQDLLELNFDKFLLQNISGFLEREKEQQILSGLIDGNISIIDPFGHRSIESELVFSKLSLKEDNLGDLSTKIKYLPGKFINFSIDLSSGINNIIFEGATKLDAENGTLKANIISKIENADFFNPLVSEYISSLGGGINGELSIGGDLLNPQIKGNLNFDQFTMNITPINTFLNTNGQIDIIDNKVSFSNLTILDSLDNKVSVTGGIDATEFSNPNFAVNLTSENFMAINSTATSNKTIVGKLMLGLNIGVHGKFKNMLITSDLSVNEGTDIAYVLPGEDLELITDEGIVIFTDYKNQLDTLLEVSSDEFVADKLVAEIKGIDLTTNLKIDPRAKFTINIDPNSGDYTFFRLKGNLQYKYNDVQRGHLKGLIEMEEGFYELSFYGLVKKRFIYEPGSTISWSEKVMNGDIRFSAKNIVKTNSVGLVSHEIGENERALYNQRLPYEVFLHINGTISYPLVSFGIDLPDRYKNDNPVIASKLQMLSQPALESERNKQVFALLVGGTFIPETSSSSDGSSSQNFATTAARNSVNAIMTQQLNNLTGQFIQGIDLDMGVNTYDDYSSGRAQSRTQLDVKVSKNLFNDRVSAEVESHINLDGSTSNPGTQSTAGMTEFAVSYKITKAGNYRIKAFRENAYDIFDGEIQNAGIAFIFVKEFDSFRKNPKKRSPKSKMSESEQNVENK